MRLQTRTIGCLCIVLLVALAGCTGGPAGDAGTNATDDGSGSPAGGQADGAGADGGSAASSGDAAGVFAGSSDVAALHENTLAAQGSYTAVMTTTSEGFGAGQFGGDGGPTGEMTATMRIDVEADTYLMEMNVPGRDTDYTVEFYKPPGEDTAYTRMDYGGRAIYSQQTQSVDTDQFSAPAAGSFYESLDWSAEGTVTRDGQALEKYVVRDVGQVEDTAYFGGTVRSIDATVLYNPATEFLQEVTWEYVTETGDGDTTRTALTLTYSNVGSTTVPEPDWLGEARSQSGSGGFSGGSGFQRP